MSRGNDGYTKENNTCELFQWTVSEKKHPLPCKQSGDDLLAFNLVVIGTENGVRSDSKYANEHGQYDDKTRQLFDLKLKQRLHTAQVYAYITMPLRCKYFNGNLQDLVYVLLHSTVMLCWCGGAADPADNVSTYSPVIFIRRLLCFFDFGGLWTMKLWLNNGRIYTPSVCRLQTILCSTGISIPHISSTVM